MQKNESTFGALNVRGLVGWFSTKEIEEVMLVKDRSRRGWGEGNSEYIKETVK